MKRTFDVVDRQTVVNVGESRVSSCKQSSSFEGTARVVLFEENIVENILLRLSVAIGDVGKRDIMVREIYVANCLD